MFEKASAAAAKAKEHLDAAETLAAAEMWGQAYAHLVLALDESAVMGIEMLTESGIVRWESPPAWFKIRKADLSRPGTHSAHLRLGLTTAAIRVAFVVPTTIDVSKPPTENAEVLAASISASMADPVPKLFGDPTFLGFLRDGDARRNAAFYSQPFKPARVPGEADYLGLHKFTRPFVIAMSGPWPTEEEFAVFRPVIEQLVPQIFQEFQDRKAQIVDSLKRARQHSGGA